MKETIIYTIGFLLIFFFGHWIGFHESHREKLESQVGRCIVEYEQVDKILQDNYSQYFEENEEEILNGESEEIVLKDKQRSQDEKSNYLNYYSCVGNIQLSGDVNDTLFGGYTDYAGRSYVKIFYD